MANKEYIYTYTNTFYEVNGEPIKDQYSFNIPKRQGDEGAEVEILKLYLGIDSQPGQSSALFDAELINRIRIWQNDHLEDIAAESGANVRVDPSFGLFDIDLGVAFVLEEQGYLGEFTYKAMIRKGFAVAAKEYLESEYWARTYLEETVGGLMSSDYGFPTQNDAVQQEPRYANKSWIEYRYVTNYAANNVEGEISERLDILSEAARDAVNQVFDFYGKPKTWVVTGVTQKEMEGEFNYIANYQSLLKDQGRIVDKFREGQRFTFTVEDPGSIYEQLNGVKVDMLFGMDLSVNSGGISDEFCIIKEISPPSLRPTSTYNITFWINRTFFEQIEGGSLTSGGTFDVTDPDVYREAAQIYSDKKRQAKELYKKAGRVVGDLNDPGKMRKQVDKFAKGQSRKAKAAARNLGNNLWDQARSGTGGPSDFERQEATKEALEEAAFFGRDIPSSVRIELRDFKQMIDDVSAKLEEYHANIQKFKDENDTSKSQSRFEKSNRPIVPDLAPREEARKLREVYVALEDFMRVNGYRLAASAPDKQDNLVISFEPVRGVVYKPGIQDPSLSPNLDEVTVNPTETGVEEIIGFQISDIQYTVDVAEDSNRPLPSGRTRFNRDNGKRPFVYPSTMGYLAQLNDIAEWIQQNPCDDLEQGNPAVVFFARWHWPEISFNFTTKKSESIINLTEPSVTLTTRNERKGETKVRTVKNLVDLKEAAILTARDEIKEQKALLDENIKAIKESTLFEKKGKIINTADVYPDFGKIPCDIEKMWEEFLNQWDMRLVMCDLQKCIPQLPRFNLKFDWKLPTLPNIPTFDPMHFVLPQLRIAINDIIMSFICKLIQSILDTVRRPDCTELLAFGALVLDDVLAKVNAFRNERRARRKNPEEEQAVIDSVGQANEALNAMGVVGPELNSDTGNLLNAVSAVLTPTELCSLFEGQASDNVLGIVLKVVQTSTSTLKEYLTTIDEVERFFFTIGSVISPEICDAIKELSDIVISQELCTTDRDLRALLEDVGATPEQIRDEMSALDQKRKILNELSKKGDFSGLLPGMTPAQLAEAGLPGPYNNAFANKMVKYGAASIFTNLKTYYSIEAAAFPSKFIDEIFEMVEPGTAGFNPIHYAKYIYYKKLSDELADKLEENENYRPRRMGRIISAKESFIVPFVDFESGVTSSRPASEVYTQEYGVERKYLPFMRVMPVASSTDEGKVELSEFADLVEENVVGYMERYATTKLVVTQTLKNILDSDVSTMVRKFPSFDGALREFHVRLATERTEIEPFDLSGLSKASVGTSVGITDLSFFDSEVKDCYRFSYDIPGTREIITRIYNEKIPEEYVDFRSSGVDVLSSRHRDKLLRPGGFATLLIQKYTELAEGNPGPNTFTDYSDGNETNMLPKILGYIENPDMDAARAAFNAVLDEEEGNSLGELLLALIVGAIAAAGEILETSNGQPLYSSVVDSFNFQLSDITKNSRFFNVDAMLELEDSLSSEYNVDIDRECYVKNSSILDFQAMVERFAKRFNEKISEAKHDPSERDFNKMGPYEEAAIESLFKSYVDFYCLEIMFKNIFLLSEVGAKRIFKSEFVIDYIVDSIATEMQGSLFSRTSITKFNEILKSITKLDDPKESIKTLVVKNLDVEEMASFIDDIYQPKYSSFKERVYNELVDNMKDVPSTEDYPKVTVLTDISALSGPRDASRQAAFLENYGGFQDVPVSARLPNLYDKFKFKEYSEELIEKKINSGHFWVEKFYRIDNFASFRAKYNKIQEYVASNPAYNRLQPLSSLHKEYISPEDLEKMLFGYQSFDKLEEYNQTIENNLERIETEYKYIKTIFLALLSNFYTGSSYKKESLASKIMIDLGMAEMSAETATRKIRTWRQIESGVLHTVETVPYDDNQIETDLAYRNGNVDIEELYKRMKSRFEIGKAVANGQINGDNLVSKSWDTIPDDNKHDTEFGTLAKHYDWVNYFDFLVPGATDLSVERKSQMIVDCLTRFVELSHNWVPRRQSSGNATDFSPVWRDYSEVLNSGYSENKFETLNIISKVKSAFRSSKYGMSRDLATAQYNFAKAAYQSSSEVLLHDQWTDTFYHFTQPRTNNRDVAGSVVYEEGDKYQEMVLSLYVSEVFSPTTDISYEESRVGILNLASSGIAAADVSFPNINIPGFGNIDLDRFANNESDIFSKQAELYDHLKNNLKVGCRLMFGHKVRRQEINFQGEGVNRIDPGHIFKNFKLRDGTTGMGLPGKSGLFSTKKAFLGHADSEPLILGVEGEGTSLNSRSAFYSNAMQVVGSRNAGLFSTHLSPEVDEKNKRIDELLGQISNLEETIASLRESSTSPAPNTPNIPGFGIGEFAGNNSGQGFDFVAVYENDLQSKKSEVQRLEDEIKEIVSVRIATDDEIDLITPTIDDVLVYSIPMDEYVIDVDCFEELFAEFEEKEKTKVSKRIEQTEQRLEELQEQNEEASEEALEQVILDSEERLSTLNEELSHLLSLPQPQRDSFRSSISLKRKQIADTEASLAAVRVNPQAFYDQQTIERIQELTEQNKTWQESVEFEGFFQRGENQTSTTGKVIRRNFLRKHLFEKYNDKIVSELLSMNKQASGKWVIDPDADPMKPHKMLFDFLFPLDRYAPLHFLQNLEIFQNEKGDVNILKATKLFVMQHMLQMHGIGNTDPKPEDSAVDDSHALLSQNVGAMELTASEIMNMIWEAILNAAKDAASAAVREIVRLVDPGYRDMRRGYLKDPCAMKEGLKGGLVGKESIRRYSGGKLDEGFGKRQGCKYFIPVNNFPVDLLEGSFELDFRRVRDASLNFAGLLQNKKRRYGLPLTPMSGLAFGVREVKGEKHSKLKRDNNCEDDCQTKPIVKPKGKCEDTDT